MTLFVQRSARDDIIRQYRYFIEIESTALARRFLHAVREAFEKIEANPNAGSPGRFANPALAGLRSRRVAGFEQIRVYYLTRDDRLTIIRVLHNRRDLGGIFDEEEVVE